MPLTTIFSGYYRAHSALIGNALEISNGGNTGVNYITPTGGTTTNYALNGSTATFNLDSGSTVIYAELILSSMSFFNIAGDTFTFKTPTATNTLSYGTLTSGFNGWSIYSQNVTALVSAGGPGVYTVSGVKCNIQSALWYFYVVYTKPTYPYKYIYYARGVQEVLTANSPVTFTLNNVYTPGSGPVQSYVLLGSTGGDTADFTTLKLNGNLIGNASTTIWNNLSPYNPRTNVQPGIICFADTNNNNIGFLDTTGTFGNANNNPYTHVNPNPNRSWVDLTGIDTSNALTNGISRVLVQISSPGGGFLLNTMAFEISSYLPPTKQVDKSFANIGDTLTYTIGLVNAATLPYTNVIITDSIPTGTTLVPNSLTLNGTSIPGSPAPPIGVNIGTISVNNASTITYQVLVSSTIPSPNPVINQAIFAFNIGGTTQILGTSVVNTTIIAAVLSSTKLSKSYSYIGDVLTYTIPIKNTGNTTALNIILLDTVPSGTSFVENSLKQDSSTLTGLNPDPPGVLLPNAIIAGATSTVTFQVKVDTLPSPNIITNSATSTYQYIVDPSIINTASGSANSNIINTTIFSAILYLNKTSAPNYADVGTTITYTILVNNSGNTSATNVIFSDTIPTGTSFINGSFSINGTTISGTPTPPGINIGTLPVGITTVSFKVTVNTIPTQNPIRNSSTTTFNYTVDPSIPNAGSGSSNSNTNNVTVSNARLSLTKNSDIRYADVGTTITYTILVNNTGNTSATNVIFSDTIPTATSFVNGSFSINGSTISGSPNHPGINLGTLPVGITTLSFKVTVNTIPTLNPIKNSATTTFNYTVDPSIPNAGSGSGNSNTNNVTVSNARLSLTKNSDISYADVGTTITYTILVNNTGNTSATNVVFIDTIPTATSFVNGSFSINGSTIPNSPNSPGINLGTLPIGITTLSFKVTVDIIPTINPIKNSATTTFNYTIDPCVPNGGSSGTNSNTSYVQINNAQLTLKKSVDKSYATCSDTLKYVIEITNTGNVCATNIVFKDTLPNGTQFISNSFTLDGVTISSANPSNGVTLNTISVGSTSTLTFKVQVLC